MADARPPSIDPPAALRWVRAAPPESPWLHEEVARRMDMPTGSLGPTRARCLTRLRKLVEAN